MDVYGVRDRNFTHSMENENPFRYIPKNDLQEIEPI